MVTANQPDTSLAVDPAFAYQAGVGLRPLPGIDTDGVWRHLSSQVAREPQDLEAHVRRITLAADAGDGGRALGALVDLFLSLGTQGKGLRKMMLKHAEKALTDEEVEYLRGLLDKGLIRGTDLPLGVRAVLDPGVMSSARMIEHSRQAAAEMSLVEQASALLDQGDLDAARRLLEEALMQSPDDEAVSNELMAIYRHSRDSQAVAAMRDRLAARHGKVPALWA